MRKLKFHIPIYDFDVTLIQTESNDDADSTLAIMRSIKCPQEYLDSVKNYIERGYHGGGGTFYNFDLKAIMVVFYDFKTEPSRWEVYSHEKRHIEDRVLQYSNVDDIESSGLLAGFLGRKFYEFMNMVKKK